MPITYFEDIAPAYGPPNKLTVEYRGLQILKEVEVNLYSVIVPEGKAIHRSLEGHFTKLDLLKSNIDQFIAEHGTYHTAFTDLPPSKRGRGRPSKARTPIEELVE